MDEVIILLFLTFLLAVLINNHKNIFNNFKVIYIMIIVINIFICGYIYLQDSVETMNTMFFVIFILLNAFVIGLSNLIENKKILVLILICYFIFIWFMPLYQDSYTTSANYLHRQTVYEYYNPYNHLIKTNKE